jgi:pimeloyl-ACP methyl ester carboxylesterase
MPTTSTAPSHPLSDGDHRAVGAGRVVRALERLSPRVASRVAEAIFVRTVRPPPRPDEAAWLAQATRGTLTVMGRRIAWYRWGPTGAPRVICTHGWWSHAGRFVQIGQALGQAGFQVLAFDAPGHGRSSGWRASMPEFARTLRAVVESVGPVHAAIGHSLGGAATIFATSRGLPATRVAVIAAPADVMVWVDRYAEALGLSPALDTAVRERLARRLDVRWEDLDLVHAATSLVIPGLVVHDRDDRDVPEDEGRALAAGWAGATFVGTTGLGHRGVLRDPEVIARVVEFMKG